MELGAKPRSRLRWGSCARRAPASCISANSRVGTKEQHDGDPGLGTKEHGGDPGLETKGQRVGIGSGFGG